MNIFIILVSGDSVGVCDFSDLALRQNANKELWASARISLRGAQAGFTAGLKRNRTLWEVSG